MSQWVDQVGIVGEKDAETQTMSILTQFFINFLSNGK